MRKGFAVPCARFLTYGKPRCGGVFRSTGLNLLLVLLAALLAALLTTLLAALLTTLLAALLTALAALFAQIILILISVR